MKSVSHDTFCFCNNTACEESRASWDSERTVVTPCGNGRCENVGVFFFFFFGGCNHVLILETSWSTCSWLSYESWLVDEAQSHPSFSHKHTHTQTQTRGFPIARGRACCYCRLSLICLALCLATRLKRLHSIDRSPLILQVLGHRDAHTGDTVLYI